MRRLLACLLVAAALPAAASAGTRARSVTVEGPAALAESGFVRAVLVPVARRKGIAVRYVSTDGASALRDLRAGKAQLALSDSDGRRSGVHRVEALARAHGPPRAVRRRRTRRARRATRPASPRSAPTDIAAALRLVAAAGTRRPQRLRRRRHRPAASRLCGAPPRSCTASRPLPVGERWYHYGATDPAAIVRSAAACGYASQACYALVDRAVFRRCRRRARRAACASSWPAMRVDAAGGNAALAHPCARTQRRRPGAPRARC